MWVGEDRVREHVQDSVKKECRDGAINIGEVQSGVDQICEMQ
ncbi:hypothetical protein GCM10008014_57960 [Paenibacillus silvae]|uniref:Uncharacterized protein n=1 Tax=Paenibacillus silvae TaxID=1325358 RepID=A0ABQ1ZQY9_9BACL|nr:hypothetical protein GCM10008014_57960 [Paenibacillus silvae]